VSQKAIVAALGDRALAQPRLNGVVLAEVSRAAACRRSCAARRLPADDD
jgi:hypothetical protein